MTEESKSRQDVEPGGEHKEDAKAMEVEEESVAFKVVIVEGKEQYQCEGCGKLSLSQQGIKQHITRSHKASQASPAKKRKERTPEKVTEKKKTKPSDVEADYSFNFDEFAEFETSSQKGVMILEDFGSTYSQGMDRQEPSDSTLEALDRTDNTFSQVKTTIAKVVAKPAEEAINTAVETIRVLRMENEALSTIVKNREAEVESKQEVIKLLQAEKNSLDDELINKDKVIREQTERIMDLEVKDIDQKANYQRMGDICKNLKATLNENKNKAGPKSDELSNKVKKLQAQMTNMSKELEEEKMRSRNLEKELVSESKLKNHFEVENARNIGMVTVLKDILEKGHQSSHGMEKKQVKCRDYEKFGSCKRAANCAFLHPNIVCQSFLTTGCRNSQCTDSHFVAGRVSPSKESKGDCSYWMDGHCRYSVERCGRRHDPEKKGSKRQDFHGRSSGLEQSLSQTQLEQIAAIMKGGHIQKTMGQEQQRPAFRQIPSPHPAIPQQQAFGGLQHHQVVGVQQQQQQVMGVLQQQATGGPQQQVMGGPQQQVRGASQQPVMGASQQQVIGAPQQPAFGGPQQMPAFGEQQTQNPQPTLQTTQQQQPPQMVQQYGGFQVGNMTSQGAGESWPTIQQAGWASTSQPGTEGPRSWM